MKAIILEGPDGAGKTTLAEAIAYQTGGEIIHSPAGRSQTWDPNWHKYTREIVNSRDEGLVILDRIPEVSELIYGTHRGWSRLEPNTWDAITHLPGGAVYIWCMPPFPTGQGHRDPFGTEIRPASVWYGYHLIYQLIRGHLPNLTYSLPQGTDENMWHDFQMDLEMLLDEMIDVEYERSTASVMQLAERYKNARI